MMPERGAHHIPVRAGPPSRLWFSSPRFVCVGVESGTKGRADSGRRQTVACCVGLFFLHCPFSRPPDALVMAEAEAGAAGTVESELDELQRRYRMMEADRKLYADEV